MIIKLKGPGKRYDDLPESLILHTVGGKFTQATSTSDADRHLVLRSNEKWLQKYQTAAGVFYLNATDLHPETIGREVFQGRQQVTLFKEIDVPAFCSSVVGCALFTFEAYVLFCLRAIVEGT